MPASLLLQQSASSSHFSLSHFHPYFLGSMVCLTAFALLSPFFLHFARERERERYTLRHRVRNSQRQQSSSFNVSFSLIFYFIFLCIILLIWPCGQYSPMKIVDMHALSVWQRLRGKNIHVSLFCFGTKKKKKIHVEICY